MGKPGKHIGLGRGGVICWPRRGWALSDLGEMGLA